MEIKCRVIKHRIAYTGMELSSHWIYNNFNIRGDALVAFTGPCEVREHLVDIIDRKNKKFIKSSLMLHFICEYFDTDLEKMILCQRLFISLIAQEINRLSGKYIVEQRGNDLYVSYDKLSVAIATLTPVSCVFHVGLNIETRGAPLKVTGLKRLSITPFRLAKNIFKLYTRELRCIKADRAKVRAVA